TLSLHALKQVHRLQLAVTTQPARPLYAAANEPYNGSGVIARHEYHESARWVCEGLVPKARAIRNRQPIQQTFREDAPVRCPPTLDMNSGDTRSVLNHGWADTPFVERHVLILFPSGRYTSARTERSGRRGCAGPLWMVASKWSVTDPLQATRLAGH